MQLDHIAIAGETLDEAATLVEEVLGVPLQAGGAHDVFHTHNRLLGLEDGLYLEAIAINPDASAPERPRWFDLDHFTGAARLTNWICRCDDLDATLAQMPEGYGAPVTLQRGDLRWRMAVPSSGVLPFDNCAPALMQWQDDAHPASRLAPSGVRLTRLVVRHPDADALRATLAPQLDDDRVVLEVGQAGLRAEFDAPQGRKVIGA